jgi:hypothetical protein
MMRRLAAAVALATGLALSTASPASAGNAVSADEFWHNLSNYTQTAFQDSLCNCSPLQSTYLDSSHDSKVVVYDAGIGYTRNVIQINIRYDLTGGHWIPHDFPSQGGKEQVWRDSAGQHTSPYPVRCLGAPC